MSRAGTGEARSGTSGPPVGRHLLLLGASLLVAGCGQGAPGPTGTGATDPAGRSFYLQARTDSGGTTFVTRIDGDVEDSVPMRLWGDEDQTVVVTGYSPGADQHRILIYSPGGQRQAEWGPSRDNPYRFLQFQHPVPRTLRLLDVGDRRFLSVFTSGIFFPSSFVLVEVGAEKQLTERMVLWNPGVLNHYAVEGETLGFAGLNNRLQVVEGRVEPRTKGGHYPLAVGVVDLSGLPAGAGGTARRVEIPATPEGKGIGYRYYYLLPVLDSAWDSQGPVVRLVHGELKASLASGLTFAVDVVTGKFRFECTAPFRFSYESRQQPGSPGVEEYLRGLEASVHTWGGLSR